MHAADFLPLVLLYEGPKQHANIEWNHMSLRWKVQHSEKQFSLSSQQHTELWQNQTSLLSRGKIWLSFQEEYFTADIMPKGRLIVGITTYILEWHTWCDMLHFYLFCWESEKSMAANENWSTIIQNCNKNIDNRWKWRCLVQQGYILF